MGGRKHDDITLQDVRRALSSIPGSLADAVIESREERRLASSFLDTSAAGVAGRQGEFILFQ